jgi:signal transduction histidine kinase
VLLNLISNSLKFTLKGSINVICKPFTGLNGEDWFIRVIVTDTGAGIKEQDKPKLFQLFGTVSHSED